MSIRKLVDLCGLDSHIEFLNYMGVKLIEHNLKDAAYETREMELELREILQTCIQFKAAEEKLKPLWDLIEKVECLEPVSPAIPATPVLYSSGELITVTIDNTRINKKYGFKVSGETTIEEFIEDTMGIEHYSFGEWDCCIQVNGKDMLDTEYVLQDGDVVTIKPVQYI